MSRFPTTAWKLIDAIKGHQSEEVFSPETNRFIIAYWKPVFRFLLRHGHSTEEAEDLTQSFFLHFLTRANVDRADRERGRFRTFLLTLLKRFLSDLGPNRGPRQMQFEKHMVPISALVTDGERRLEPAKGESPETLFMREWARAVLGVCLKRLKIWCDDQGRPDWFAIFEMTRIQSESLSQQAIADRLHITRDQVRYAQEQTETVLRRLLRNEVAGQISNEDEIDDEVRQLRELL